MRSNTIIHFGAGALGRGLVIPILTESGKNVIVADTDWSVIHQLQKENSYTLIESDALEKEKKIPILNALHSIEEKDQLIAYLQQTDTITTSVRRENLKYLVPLIREAWMNEDCSNKKIICCENVEHVGSYFRSLLLDTEEGQENLNRIMIPDTVVDRICAASPNAVITSETFFELSVDRNTLPDTQIEKISSVDNITGHFFRKRYLLNSYADAIAFLGRAAGMTYLYEAVADETLNQTIEPLISQYCQLLSEIYSISPEECRTWHALYRKRLSNPEIPRELSTVARSLWDKLSLEERFILPLVQLKQRGYETQNSIVIIRKLIDADNKLKEKPLSNEDIIEKLAIQWSGSKEGTELLLELQSLYERGGDK